MEEFVKGDILIVEFPFSNLKILKRRPILVLKVPKGEDLLVVQITGSSYEKAYELILRNEDFKVGSLKRDSYVRIDKIASLEKSLIKYKLGSLKKEKFNEISEKICSFIKN